MAVKRVKQNLSIEAAQNLIIGSMPVLGTMRVAAWTSIGSVLRQDIISDIDYPTADVSTRDGYCLRAADTSKACGKRPVTLKVVGAVHAGKGPGFRIHEGECARVTTGAVLPGGADAVVPFEAVTVADDAVALGSPVEAISHVRLAGQIMTKGERILEAGRLVAPAAAGLLATLGIESVVVSREPQVGVLATGDELVPPASRPSIGQIRSSTTRLLAGLLSDIPAAVLDAEISRDVATDIARHLKNCNDCEMVLVSGGTGAGERDQVREALGKMGAVTLIDGVRARPGGSVLVARNSDQVLFCLPGSPVACFILYHLLVRPALLAMMGARHAAPVPLKARWAAGSRELSGTYTLMPGRLASDLGVEPLRSIGLGDILGLIEANCLVCLPDDVYRIKHDQVVDVLPVGPIPWSGL